MSEKILHLTLLRKWFDEIVSGNKKEEYRDVKPYWDRRLLGKNYDKIYFKNGYGKNVPFMIVECKGIEKRNETYVIILGKILKLENYPKALLN